MPGATSPWQRPWACSVFHTSVTVQGFLPQGTQGHFATLVPRPSLARGGWETE